MHQEQSYQTKKEKDRRIEIRLSESMLIELSIIRKNSSISISELAREGIRRVIKDFKENSEIKLI
jgi:hypothetical protein